MSICTCLDDEVGCPQHGGLEFTLPKPLVTRYVLETEHLDEVSRLQARVAELEEGLRGIRENAHPDCGCEPRARALLTETQT